MVRVGDRGLAPSYAPGTIERGTRKTVEEPGLSAAGRKMNFCMKETTASSTEKAAEVSAGSGSPFGFSNRLGCEGEDSHLGGSL